MLIIFSIILVICLHNDGGGGSRVGLHPAARNRTKWGEIMQMLRGFLGLDFSFNSGIYDCDKMQLRLGCNCGI